MANNENEELKRQLQAAKDRSQKRWTESILSTRRADRAEKATAQLESVLQNALLKHDRELTRYREALEALQKELRKEKDERVQATAQANVEKHDAVAEVQEKHNKISQQYKQYQEAVATYMRKREEEKAAAKQEAETAKMNAESVKQQVDELKRQVAFFKNSMQERALQQPPRKVEALPLDPSSPMRDLKKRKLDNDRFFPVMSPQQRDSTLINRSPYSPTAPTTRNSNINKTSSASNLSLDPNYHFMSNLLAPREQSQLQAPQRHKSGFSDYPMIPSSTARHKTHMPSPGSGSDVENTTRQAADSTADYLFKGMQSNRAIAQAAANYQPQQYQPNLMAGSDMQSQQQTQQGINNGHILLSSQQTHSIPSTPEMQHRVVQPQTQFVGNADAIDLTQKTPPKPPKPNQLGASQRQQPPQTHVPSPLPPPPKLRIVSCIHCHNHFWNETCDNSEPCRNCSLDNLEACHRPKCEHFDNPEECKKGRDCPRAHQSDPYTSFTSRYTKTLKRKIMKKNIPNYPAPVLAQHAQLGEGAGTSEVQEANEDTDMDADAEGEDE